MDVNERFGNRVVREWEVESESTPGKFYVVTMWLQEKGQMKAGSFSCTCPAWRFQRRAVSDRVCKHVKGVLEEVRYHDTGHAIREIEGSEVEFEEEAVVNGRLQGLIESLMKQ